MPVLLTSHNRTFMKRDETVILSLPGPADLAASTIPFRFPARVM